MSLESLGIFCCCLECKNITNKADFRVDGDTILLNSHPGKTILFFVPIITLLPGDPKKGIPFWDFKGGWLLTKLPTKHIFRFLIKCLPYSEEYFQRFC